uniref:ORF168 n=1 Tax=Kryptoperidinium foliaceum endosymbiont TaxID=1079369 RepID=I6N5U3_9STRA|nr:ORF168 [Kryptoperidinium foliaceum endosymbiont]
MISKIQKLTDCEAAYLAGFLDGDGSICAKIVKDPTRIHKYAIRIEICFIQKKNRRFFLKRLQNQLGCGNLNLTEESLGRTVDNLTIGKLSKVRELLIKLKCHLQLKKGQAKYAIDIIDNYYQRKNITLDQFCLLCENVDKLTALNDSKKKKGAITGALVIKELRANNS